MGTFKTWNDVMNVTRPTSMPSINILITSPRILSYARMVYVEGPKLASPKPKVTTVNKGQTFNVDPLSNKKDET